MPTEQDNLIFSDRFEDSKLYGELVTAVTSLTKFGDIWGAQMQQGRRSASMKASYEALQQLTQGTELGLLGAPAQTVTLPPSEIREVAANQVVVATTTHSTKKQKKSVLFFFLIIVFSNEHNGMALPGSIFYNVSRT